MAADKGSVHRHWWGLSLISAYHAADIPAIVAHSRSIAQQPLAADDNRWAPPLGQALLLGLLLTAERLGPDGVHTIPPDDWDMVITESQTMLRRLAPPTHRDAAVGLVEALVTDLRNRTPNSAAWRTPATQATLHAASAIIVILGRVPLILRTLEHPFAVWIQCRITAIETTAGGPPPHAGTATRETSPLPQGPARSQGSEVTDRQARRLLLGAFRGDNLFDIDEDPTRWDHQAKRIIDVVKVWAREHGTHAPPLALREFLAATFVGVGPARQEHPSEAIPADAHPLDEADHARLPVLALTLLLGFLDGDHDAIRDAGNGIDRLGEAGYRHALTHLRGQGGSWFNQAIARGVVLRSSQLIPGLTTMIDTWVPETRRDDVWKAYLPVMMRATDHGGSFHPEVTADVEADLYLFAAYVAFYGSLPQVEPDTGHIQLRAAVAYLRRPDRTATASTFTREQRQAAVDALREAFGPEVAGQVAQLPVPFGDEDRLLAVAYDVSAGADGGAAAQMRRQHDIVQELWADQREDAATAPTHQAPQATAPRRLTDDERTTRQAAERARRARKKPGRGGKR